VRAVLVDLDGVIGDTRPLWDAWLDDLERRSRIAVDDLPQDRTAAASVLDDRLANWRALLERFAAEHAPVYLRPDPETNARLRALEQATVRIGAFSDAPPELAQAALTQLGAGRRVACVGTLDEVSGVLGADALVVRTRTELAALP
jgi:phosphoglycolate phosphatase-like HAD superfamily hydrolase